MNPVADFLFVVYSIIHLQFLWAVHIIWRWNKLSKAVRPKEGKSAFCERYALRAVFMFGVDTVLILPLAIRIEAIPSLIPWFAVKAGLLMLIFAEPTSRD